MPCYAPNSGPYTMRFAPSASASANCAISNERNSNPSPPKAKGRPRKGPAFAISGGWLAVAYRSRSRLGLRRGLSGLLGAARNRVLLFEAIDSSGGVHQLLAAREERVARRADFHTHVALMGRARLEGVAAGAGDINFVVSGVNSSLHFAGGPF